MRIRFRHPMEEVLQICTRNKKPDSILGVVGLRRVVPCGAQIVRILLEAGLDLNRNYARAGRQNLPCPLRSVQSSERCLVQHHPFDISQLTSKLPYDRYDEKFITWEKWQSSARYVKN